MYFYILSLLASLSSAALCADSLDNFKFGAASVLPITSWFRPQEGKVIDYVILAREAYGKDVGTYDDFGGKKEKDHATPLDTAANEFWEEAILRDTLGWSVDKVKKYIHPGESNTEVVIAKKGTPNYVTYITRFDNKLIESWQSKFFHARNKQKQYKFKEKDSVATVRWDDLAQAIKSSPGSSNVTVQARLIDPQTGKEKSYKESIVLRPKLVWVLRPYLEGWPYIPGDNPKIRFYDTAPPKMPPTQDTEPLKLLSELEVNLQLLAKL